MTKINNKKFLEEKYLEEDLKRFAFKIEFHKEMISLFEGMVKDEQRIFNQVFKKIKGGL
jgi:hypothetical protein